MNFFSTKCDFHHLSTKHLFFLWTKKSTFLSLFYVDNVDNFVQNSILSRFFKKIVWITIFLLFSKFLQKNRYLYKIYKYPFYCNFRRFVALLQSLYNEHLTSRYLSFHQLHLQFYRSLHKYPHDPDNI